MRLGFATDIHLDHLKDSSQRQLAGREIARGLDALVIGGDISTGPLLKEQLSDFCSGAEIPVHFVLGNHDFWDLPVVDVRAAAAYFPGYLDDAGVVALTPSTALVGRSGWYDTLSGNPYAPSNVRIADWRRVERLVYVFRLPHLLQAECRAWSTEEAEKARPVLEEAAAKFPRVMFVTHFPCFEEAVWNENGQLDVVECGMWPWSLNTTMGRVLLDTATKHPEVQFTLLTGHTHGEGRKQLRDNLLCVAGKARYGHPQLAHEFILTL